MEPVEVKVVRLEERMGRAETDISSLQGIDTKYEERLRKLENINNRNAVVISYVERIGWAVCLAVLSAWNLKDKVFS